MLLWPFPLRSYTPRLLTTSGPLPGCRQNEAAPGCRATPVFGRRFSAHVAALDRRPAGRGKRPRDRRPGGADAAPAALRQGLRLRDAVRRFRARCRRDQPAEGARRAAGLHQCPLRRRSRRPSAGRRRGRRRPAAVPLSSQMGRGARSAQGAPARAALPGRCRRSAAPSAAACPRTRSIGASSPRRSSSW